jgi:hypothetical protein
MPFIKTTKGSVLKTIVIKSGDVSFRARLRNTPTAKTIYNALPLDSRVRTWGEEVYFQVPIEAELEADARDIVNAGELAFWVEGQCIAIGYGPTPISQQGEIRLAARTNIWADALDDVTQLKEVRPDAPIRMEVAGDSED